jgi:hypothetical protein
MDPGYRIKSGTGPAGMTYLGTGSTDLMHRCTKDLYYHEMDKLTFRDFRG